MQTGTDALCFLSHHFLQCRKLKGVCDTQTPVCPVCQDLLRPSELQEHMEHEMERLTQLHLSQSPSQTQCAPAGLPKSVFSLHIKREGGSCGSSPRPAEEAVHSDRYQMFLRVRANRQTRLGGMELNVPTSFIFKWNTYATDTPTRIGKMKRRKTEEEQRDSVCAVENGSLGAGADEYGWSEHRRMHMVSILRGFRGTHAQAHPQSTHSLVSSTSKEPHDSDVDLDVDGDDTLSYGKAQYPSHCVPQMCDDSLNTLEALKTRIRDLEKQLTRGDRIKCLICMDSYAVPLTSIQCWHVHCEECWLRTL
ncbi:hypothetical protein P4O66_022688, partial [Electrophorus voltai]